MRNGVFIIIQKLKKFSLDPGWPLTSEKNQEKKLFCVFNVIQYKNWLLLQNATVINWFVWTTYWKREKGINW